MPETGFTGLEAAIVLIAFIVVAAVFSYTALAAGFLFSGESRSVVHQGVRQAGSACTLAGTVYGISGTSDYVDSILVPVKLTADGEPIDITTVSVRIVGPRHKEVLAQNELLMDAYPAQPGLWSVQQSLNSDGDLLLETGEEFILNITPAHKDDCAPYGSFVVEIKPAGRAALRVERTVPGRIDRVTRFY